MRPAAPGPDGTMKQILVWSCPTVQQQQGCTETHVKAMAFPKQLEYG